MGKRAPKKGGMRWGGATFAVTLGESAPAGFTTKAHGTGAAGLMSSSMRKKAVGVKLAGRLGQKLEHNDLRLRMGTAAPVRKASKPEARVTFVENAGSIAESVQPVDAGDRWANDMYFKSGQDRLAPPMSQAVTERAPSFLTTAGGRRREIAASALGVRALASAGIMSKARAANSSRMTVDKGPRSGAKLDGIVRKGRGTFSWQG